MPVSTVSFPELDHSVAGRALPKFTRRIIRVGAIIWGRMERNVSGRDRQGPGGVDLQPCSQRLY
jgi:hypothetical protein